MINQSNNLSTFEKFLALVGGTSVCFFAMLVIVSSVGFVFRVPTGYFGVLISTIMTIIFSMWFCRKIGGDVFVHLLSVSITTIVLVLSFAAVSMVYDTSYDGQAYHQEAIVLLDHGWNPFYKKLTNEATANMEFWLNHYPRANWIIAADIYKVTKNIESGKVLSLFSGFIAFVFVLLGIQRLRINSFMKFLIALLFAISPVFIYQSLSYYLDGVVVSLMVAILFMCFRIVTVRERFFYWPFVFTSIILVNTKLASVVFYLALCTTVFMYMWFSDQLKQSLWFIKMSVIAFVISFFFIGFNPFVTNYAGNGHPLYPAMGKGAYDYVKNNTPENYWKMLPPARLFASIFSKSSLARGEGKNGEFKLPYTIENDELSAFTETNVKTGGFGPLYAMAFLLAFIGLVMLMFADTIKPKTKLTVLFAFTLILLVAGVMPTSSVARYVPFVWWAPLVVALALAATKEALYKTIAAVIAVALVINNGLIVWSYYPNAIKLSQQTDKQLTELSANTKEPLRINFAQYGSTKIKLMKYHVPFVEAYPDESCDNSRRLIVGNISKVCGETTK
jgi:hypothetical protein